MRIFLICVPNPLNFHVLIAMLGLDLNPDSSGKMIAQPHESESRALFTSILILKTLVLWSGKHLKNCPTFLFILSLLSSNVTDNKETIYTHFLWCLKKLRRFLITEKHFFGRLGEGQFKRLLGTWISASLVSCALSVMMMSTTAFPASDANWLQSLLTMSRPERKRLLQSFQQLRDIQGTLFLNK